MTAYNSTDASASDDAPNIEILQGSIMIGICTILAVIVLLALVSFTMEYKHVSSSVVTCGVAIADIVTIWLLIHWGRRQAVAYLIVALYMLLAADMVWSWGLTSPIGVIVFSIVAILSSLLLLARHAIWAAAGASLILIVVQVAYVLEWRMPTVAWPGNETYYTDALVYGFIFGMFALMSWIHNSEMEVPRLRARRAEAALVQQQVVLRRTVKKRTAQLRHVQLEEMQQMYRFAELGQLGVTLLHDLANHLTALTLEIEGMQNKQNTKELVRAQQITGYLEAVVDNTRTRLQGDTQNQSFDLVRTTNEVVAFLGYKADKGKVIIDWQSPIDPIAYIGDPTCISQVVAIIINNAVDAYGTDLPNKGHYTDKRKVDVAMYCDKKYVNISISDRGKGITKCQRKLLFKPFNSSKKTGLGIGLFIARQTVEVNFGGTIFLNPKNDRTEFIIRLPLQHEQLDKN